MSLTACLHGGPKDGGIIKLASSSSVPYELQVDLEPFYIDGLEITGSVIYRRRGGLDTEPIRYDFAGPAKRGSRR